MAHRGDQILHCMDGRSGLEALDSQVAGAVAICQSRVSGSKKEAVFSDSLLAAPTRWRLEVICSRYPDTTLGTRTYFSESTCRHYMIIGQIGPVKFSHRPGRRALGFGTELGLRLTVRAIARRRL